MRYASFLLVCFSFLPHAAVADEPCRASVLKRYTCSLTDAASGAGFRLQLTRAQLVGEGCSRAGAVEETARAVIAPASEYLSDLYLPRGETVQAVTELEAGRPLDLVFYSAGDTTVPERARVRLRPDAAGGVEADVDFASRVNRLFSHPGLERVSVRGTTRCELSH